MAFDEEKDHMLETMKSQRRLPSRWVPGVDKRWKQGGEDDSGWQERTRERRI